MSGFEFPAVVRRRFPGIPVVVISGAFFGLSVPENLLADAFLSKEPFRPAEVVAVITRLNRELPTLLPASRPERAAVWMRNVKRAVVVTCSECFRTFPVARVSRRGSTRQSLISAPVSSPLKGRLDRSGRKAERFDRQESITGTSAHPRSARHVMTVQGLAPSLVDRATAKSCRLRRFPIEPSQAPRLGEERKPVPRATDLT